MNDGSTLVFQDHVIASWTSWIVDQMKQMLMLNFIEFRIDTHLQKYTIWIEMIVDRTMDVALRMWIGLTKR